ncbi:6-phosphogluconolactonase [Tropicibacter sp. Alg240-R139]|uniref:6-phosphogluconolactonase n=1 Tax=Tropicibacter sp. Alg240-R139 TaxID=2305991 RepID=UPI0013E030A4|nr:6-phosphogluconolactonase [Tropicibacter sp. Alg240-R139]
MRLVEYADRDMLAIDVANVLAGALETALLHHETVSFAVPGGTTPGSVFDALCAANLEWYRVHVFPTDERCVDETDERSNAKLIKERLLTNRASSAVFLPLFGGGSTSDQNLAETEAMLAPHLPLSVLLLGMGGDMHTASLFPGMKGLEAALSSNAPVLTVARPETQPEARVSLTGQALDGALSKHLVIFGAEKREALERAMTLPPEEAPISAVVNNTNVYWAE